MTSRFRTTAVMALLASPLLALGAQRAGEQTSDFTWSENVADGRLVRASNVNGRITVRAGSGDRLELTATKRWRRGDPASVRVEARKVGEDVVICVLYEGQDACGDRRPDRDRGWRNRNSEDDDVTVDFTILLPPGTRLSAASVNGPVAVAGATAEVTATTVNGSVDVETSGGPLTATTVNGSIYARVSGDAARRPMSFATVNGDVVAELPAGAGASVQMTTLNGEFRSDFEMSMRGLVDPRNLDVHVGAAGGPTISLKTVNGNVQIRKR